MKICEFCGRKLEKNGFLKERGVGVVKIANEKSDIDKIFD